jgi:uncharacterized OB-fold protein
MGRRWWQKEARRIQNEQVAAPVVVLSVEQAAAPVVVSPVEEVEDITDIHVAADAAAVELTETVATISDDDVDQVVLTAEQEAIEDAKDAEVPAPVKVTIQNNFSKNKKKRR